MSSGRRPRAANVTPWWTPKVGRSSYGPSPPIFRTPKVANCGAQIGSISSVYPSGCYPLPVFKGIPSGDDPSGSSTSWPCLTPRSAVT